MPTVTVSVALSSDDAWKRYQDAEQFQSTGTSMYVGKADATHYAYCTGYVFDNITVPQAATISSAKLTVTSAAGDASTLTSKIRAYDADDYSDDLSSEAEWDAIFPGSLTTAEVDWVVSDAWLVDTEYTSPSFHTVIQEVVDRGGWSSGNTMVIFWDDHDERSSGHRNVYEKSVAAPAGSEAELEIKYSVAGQVIRVNIT